LLQLAFLGAAPTSSLNQGWASVGTNFSGDTDVLAQFGPLAAIGGVLGASRLAVLLYVDAVVSPGGHRLIYTAVTSRPSYAMARDGNVSSALARMNPREAPWVSTVLVFVVGLIFFLPIPGWRQLVGFTTSATVLSFGPARPGPARAGPLALVALSRQLPDRERRSSCVAGSSCRSWPSGRPT
jgi:amino acid transporter